MFVCRSATVVEVGCRSALARTSGVETYDDGFCVSLGRQEREGPRIQDGRDETMVLQERTCPSVPISSDMTSFDVGCVGQIWSRCKRSISPDYERILLCCQSAPKTNIVDGRPSFGASFGRVCMSRSPVGGADGVGGPSMRRGLAKAVCQHGECRRIETRLGGISSSAVHFPGWPRNAGYC